MEALPTGAPPAPRNQLIVGTAIALMMMGMLTGGLLAIWAVQRDRAIETDGRWLPSGVVIPEVPSNVMLIAFIGVCSFAQWAIWAANRQDRPNTVFALGCTAFVAILIINAQLFIYSQIDVGLAEGPWGSMFFAITGAFVAMMTCGVIFSIVAAFRFAGGRARDRELLTAHAIFWYSMSVIYAAIWLLVYVTK